MRRNRYAILFLDVGLAGTPGLEVARKLRQNGDNCQIVFLSRDSSPALTCYQVHPAGFFLKPVFPHQLQELLNWNRNIFLSTMNSITVVFARRPRRLLLADILYITVSGRTSQICLAQEIIPTNRALNELQASLPKPAIFSLSQALSGKQEPCGGNGRAESIARQWGFSTGKRGATGGNEKLGVRKKLGASIRDKYSRFMTIR